MGRSHIRLVFVDRYWAVRRCWGDLDALHPLADLPEGQGLDTAEIILHQPEPRANMCSIVLHQWTLPTHYLLATYLVPGRIGNLANTERCQLFPYSYYRRPRRIHWFRHRHAVGMVEPLSLIWRSYGMSRRWLA